MPTSAISWLEKGSRDISGSEGFEQEERRNRRQWKTKSQIEQAAAHSKRLASADPATEQFFQLRASEERLQIMQTRPAGRFSAVGEGMAGG